MDDNEFQEIKESIENLHRKIDKIALQVQPRPKFLWREFWIGFGVVFVIMMVFFVVVAIILHH